MTKEELIAERKALNEQIDRIEERRREIAVALDEIEKTEYKEEIEKKIASATHTAMRVRESYRSGPWTQKVYVRETPAGWKNVLDGELFKKSDNPTESKEKREPIGYLARYVYLKDITPICSTNSTPSDPA